MDATRKTPQEIAADALAQVAWMTPDIRKRFALAATLLHWEGEAAAVLQVRFERWLLDTLSTAPVQQGHAADELTPTTDEEATA